MTYSGYYEFTISQIDYGIQEISEFDNETLFMNIYHFWCFSKYLSPYFIWGDEALTRLKRNIKSKWSSDFTNVNLFIELIKKQLEPINPCDYFFQSEDYFVRIMSSKTVLDDLVKKRHLPKTSKKISKIRKCIRKCIR